MSRRLGILGGTFDPPHAAHVEIARAVLAAGLADDVLIVPAGDPWQKADVTPAADRLAMTRLAFADEPHCSVSDIEVERSGATYAIDTVTALSQPDLQLRYIVGSDTLAALDSWHRIADVARLCDFLVVPRPGTAVVAPPISHLRHEVVPMRPVDQSSTNIRASLAAGGPRPRSIPTSVWNHIVQRRLYGVRHSTLRRPLIMFALGILAAVAGLLSVVTLAARGEFFARDLATPEVSSGWVVIGVRAPESQGGVITMLAVGGPTLEVDTRQLTVTRRPLQLNDPDGLRSAVADELRRPMAGAVIFDRLAFAGLVDAVDGITMGSTRLDGLAAADAVLADPTGARLQTAMQSLLRELPTDPQQREGLIRSLGSAMKGTVGASTVAQWLEFWQRRL